MNQDLFFEEKNFISVARASEETGYTQDYLGQLSRSAKIPARMVGRTWYVDKEALLGYKKYKKNIKLQSKKNVEQGVEKISLPQSPVSYTPTITYAKDFAPVRPLLKAKTKITSQGAITKSLPYICAVFIFVFALTSFAHVSLSRIAEIANNQFNGISDDFGVISSRNLGAVSTTQLPKTSAQGVVVFPDPAKHDEAVAAVQASFSDDATIMFDKSGTSGVITPTFREGVPTEGYAFVMVPIKNQTK